MGCYLSAFCTAESAAQAGMPGVIRPQLHHHDTGDCSGWGGHSQLRVTSVAHVVQTPKFRGAMSKDFEEQSGWSVFPACLGLAAVTTTAAAASSSRRRQSLGTRTSCTASTGPSAPALTPRLRAMAATLTGRNVHRIVPDQLVGALASSQRNVAAVTVVASLPLAIGDGDPPPSVLGVGRRGIIGSFSDLPKMQALGIELRASAALAAPVSVVDGVFLQEPFRVRHAQPLGVDTQANAEIISSTVQQLIDHFKWKGVLGCSISRRVAFFLGCDSADASFAVMEDRVSNLLAKCLRGKVLYAVSMVHTTAAGYNELVYGDSASEACWHDKVVLLCTLGKDISAMLFNDGHRVRLYEWSQDNDEEGHSSEWIALNSALAYQPPTVGSSLWYEWARYIDDQICSMMKSIPKLDRVVVMPTGRTARLSPTLNAELRPLLQQTLAEAATRNGEVVFVEQQEGAVVRGAALSSLVELQTAQMMRQLEPMLMGAHSLQALSDVQLRTIFDKFDADGDGQLKFGELLHGLEIMGLPRDEKALFQEFEGHDNGLVSTDEFVDWWLRHIKKARVVTITSVDAWDKLLESSAPPGFGDLILLEVTFTFCRTCRRFEPKFRTMAERFTDVRFVTLVGNGTVGSMELCTKKLKVTSSPTFFVFRRGGELVSRWTGANLSKCEEKLRACIEQVAGASDAASVAPTAIEGHIDG